ncbi:MAG: hypothetical protein V8T90_05150 [Victivallales bacterium]
MGAEGYTRVTKCKKNLADALVYSAKPFAQTDINGLLKVKKIAQTFLHKKRPVCSKRFVEQTFRERNRGTVRL